MADILCADLRPTAATIEYLKPLQKYCQEKPYLLSYGVPLSDESYRTNLEFEQSLVALYDLRPICNKVRFETSGFELLDIPRDALSRYFGISSTQSELEGVRTLLQARFDAEKVITYDHAVSAEIGDHTKSVILSRDFSIG